MGIVSRGPGRCRLNVLGREGEVFPSNPIDGLSADPYWTDRVAGSGAGSELTTTIGGTEETVAGVNLRSEVEAP